jgi:hypothetical protein
MSTFMEHIHRTTFTGFICKRCGAESPVGIGYAATQPEAGAPKADCPNPHTQGA